MTALELDTHHHQLRTLTDLAAQMGVSRNYVIAMKRHGFVMPGRKASLAMARHFLTHCSDFQVREPGKAPTPQMDASCDTAHEPTHLRAQRKPSSGIRKIQLRKASSPR